MMATAVENPNDTTPENGNPSQETADQHTPQEAGAQTKHPNPDTPSTKASEARPRRTPNTQNRRPQDQRYLMLPMPNDKKTNSRAGIRRPMHLCTRLSQEMYFRAYEKVSDGNFFLERIYPGMVDGRSTADAPTVKAGFEEITSKWKGLYEEVKNTFDNMIQNISERLEAEGVDASGIQLDFSQALDEEALVTSRMDQHYLNTLQLVDKVSGFIAAASLYDVYSAEESAKLEREVRQVIINVYRYTLRYRYETAILLRSGKTGEMRRAEKAQEQAEKTEKANGKPADADQKSAADSPADETAEGGMASDTDTADA